MKLIDIDFVNKRVNFIYEDGKSVITDTEKKRICRIRDLILAAYSEVTKLNLPKFTKHAIETMFYVTLKTISEEFK